jgi:hypothetical protein
MSAWDAFAAAASLVVWSDATGRIDVERPVHLIRLAALSEKRAADC